MSMGRAPTPTTAGSYRGFPSQGEESLFDRVWLDAAADRWESGELHAKAIGMPPILSCDPARYGSDSSVLAICRGMVIEKLIVWRNTDTMRTVSRIEEEAAKVGVRPYRPASDYLPPSGTIQRYGDGFSKRLLSKPLLKVMSSDICSAQDSPIISPSQLELMALR